MEKNIFTKVTPKTIERYKHHLLWQKRLSHRTIQRKSASLSRFFSFLEGRNYITSNPFKQPEEQGELGKPDYPTTTDYLPRPIDKFLGIDQSKPSLPLSPQAADGSTSEYQFITSDKGIIGKLRSFLQAKKPAWYHRYHQNLIVHYLHFGIFVIILSSIGYGVYDQFFHRPSTPLAYPPATTNVTPPRTITFQGKLTDKQNIPIVSPSLVTFRLWNAAIKGTRLYSSGKCVIKPDHNGVFTTIIGKSCGPPIPARTFSENQTVFIGITVGNDSEMKPRHQIPTTAYALNTETLQGHPPSASAAASQIPVITESGDLVIASPNPRIYSTSGTFQLRGQAISMITDTGTDGDITISPDGKGKLNLVFGGVSGKQLNLTAANLGTNGTLLYGGVTNDSNTCRLIQLQSGTSILGSSYLTDRFIIDCAGNVEISNKLQVAGDLSSAVAYSRIGSQQSNRGLSNPQDLLVSGRFEVDNEAFFDSTTAIMHKLGIRKTNPTYELDVGGNIGLNQYIFHNDDSDTFLNFTDDSLKISIGGTGFLHLSEGDDPDILIGNYDNANIDFRWDGDSNDSLFFIDASAERVGIGTSSPGKKLEVNGDVRLDASGTATTNGLCHSGADSDTTFSDRDIVACNGAPGDVAEWYETKDGEPGDIMITTDKTITYDSPVVNALTGEVLNKKVPLTASILAKANKPYQSNIIGIISTSPYQTMGRAILDYAKNPNPIAVVGRTPVKVSTINGPIAIGDPITTSIIPGVGMKATKPGVIISRALESFQCFGSPCSNNIKILYWTDKAGQQISEPETYQGEKYPVAKIQVFVNIGWHHPSWQLSDNGELQPTNEAKAIAPDNPLVKPIPSSNPSTPEVGKNSPETSPRDIEDKEIISSKPSSKATFSGFSGIIELYQTGESFIESTDVVSLNRDGKLVKTQDDYSEKMIGVVSTIPSDTDYMMADEQTNATLATKIADKKPVVLIGPTRVKVSTRNGPIKIGDLLTSSPIAGVAMKASRNGPILGKALQDYLAPTDQLGIITVFVFPASFQEFTQATNLAAPMTASASATMLPDNLAAIFNNYQELAKRLQELKTRVNQANLAAASSNQSIATPTGPMAAATITPISTTAVDKLTTSPSSTISAIWPPAALWPITSPEKDIEISNLLNTGQEALLTYYDLTVLGQTSLGETFVHGPLYAPGLTLDKSAINSFRSSLKLQDTASFPLEIMAGKITIGTNGDLTMKGNLLAQGGITTGLIRPIPEGDIVIDLATKTPRTLAKTTTLDSSEVKKTPDFPEVFLGSQEQRQPNEVTNPKSAFGRLLVRGVGGKTVASIDSKGNANFSGDLSANQITSAELKTDKLLAETIYTDNLKLTTASYSGAIIAAAEVATRSGILATGIKTNATTGQAVLMAGQTELVIFTPYVTKDSFVYLTPLSPTENKVLYVSGKKSASCQELESRNDEIQMTNYEPPLLGSSNPASSSRFSTICQHPIDGYIHIALDKPISHDIKFNWWIIN